jgi:hypothetical protein
VTQNRPVLFRERHFEDVTILLRVRWYLRYSLSYRDLEEMMAERGLWVAHVTIWTLGTTLCAHSAGQTLCQEIPRGELESCLVRVGTSAFERH